MHNLYKLFKSYGNPMETSIKFSSGNKVIASGSVITLEGQSTIIALKNLEFEFKFVDDNSNKLHTVFEPIDDKRLLINLYNFNDSIGAGNTVPMEVGNLSQRRLYLLCWIRDIPGKKEERKIINYTFFLEEEEKKEGEKEKKRKEGKKQDASK